MKYDILVQIFTSVHPILSVYIFTGSKTIFAKKSQTFLAKKFQNLFLSKSVFGYYKKENKKKWHGPLNHQGGVGVKSLVVRPLKKTLFLCVSSLKNTLQLKYLFYIKFLITLSTSLFLILSQKEVVEGRTECVHCTKGNYLSPVQY